MFHLLRFSCRHYKALNPSSQPPESWKPDQGQLALGFPIPLHLRIEIKRISSLWASAARPKALSPERAFLLEHAPFNSQGAAAQAALEEIGRIFNLARRLFVALGLA